MKLEIGKTYATRNGGRAEVSDALFGVFRGTYIDTDGRRAPQTWYATGRVYYNGHQSPMDVVGESLSLAERMKQAQEDMMMLGRSEMSFTEDEAEQFYQQLGIMPRVPGAAEAQAYFDGCAKWAPNDHFDGDLIMDESGISVGRAAPLKP